MKKKEWENGREGDRGTKRQRDRGTEGQRNRETERQKDKGRLKPCDLVVKNE